MNKLLAVFVPLAVVTSTLAVPAVPAVVVQVTDVSVLERSEVHALPPMLTLVALVKYVPEIVTLVPPTMLPLVGVTAVNLGGSAPRYRIT